MSDQNDSSNSTNQEESNINGNNDNENTTSTSISSPKIEETSKKSNESDKNEVRVFKPKLILLSFHGTISPMDWEEECLLPYVKKNLHKYLDKHWNDIEVIDLVDKLRQQSHTQYYVYEDETVPLIPEVDDSDDDVGDQAMKKSVFNFIIWQINNEKDSPESLALQKLVWVNGYEHKQIKTTVFDDVLKAFNAFRKLHINIALFASLMSSDIMKLCLSSTTSGDLTEYFHSFLDKTSGPRDSSDTFKGIAKKLNVKPNDILYVTCFGSEAKEAHSCGYSCLLIIRPDNRRIREYYRLKFSIIHSLLDINFVNKSN